MYDIGVQLYSSTIIKLNCVEKLCIGKEYKGFFYVYSDVAVHCLYVCDEIGEQWHCECHDIGVQWRYVYDDIRVQLS